MDASPAPSASSRDDLFRRLDQVIRDAKVLDALRRVPREQFVPSELRPLAWENRPLPIGNDQTISQPEIVAVMTEALALRGDEKVLEVGAGSGYQAAVLAELAAEVIGVERYPSLLRRARRVLEGLGYHNVRLEPAGAVLGRPEDAPFDAIIVTAAAPRVPPELVAQLRPGGRLVLPAGSRTEQDLLRLTKRLDGAVEEERLGPCRFVPLIGPGAWPEAPA